MTLMLQGQTWRWVFVVALLGSVVASGVQVVYTAHTVRGLHAQLDQLAGRYDEMLADNTRLMLEREALASYAHVERTASQELAMHFPDRVAPLDETATPHPAKPTVPAPGAHEFEVAE